MPEHQTPRSNARPTSPDRRATNPSRLLTPGEAANYLGFRSTAVLRGLPIAPIHLATVGVGRAPRYDRKALDAYLDARSGLANSAAANDADDRQEAETELEAWSRNREARSR